MKSFFYVVLFIITVYLNYYKIESESLTKLPKIIKNFHVPLNQTMIIPSDTYGKYSYKNRRQVNDRDAKTVQQFQEIIDTVKMTCANETGLNSQVSTKSLLYKEYPTLEEKCLSACILKKMKLMNSNNKLNTKTITRIAGLVSNDNPMVISAVLNTANNCNNNAIKAREPCEAAYQINKCILGELKANKMKLFN